MSDNLGGSSTTKWTPEGVPAVPGRAIRIDTNIKDSEGEPLDFQTRSIVLSSSSELASSTHAEGKVQFPSGSSIHATSGITQDQLSTIERNFDSSPVSSLKSNLSDVEKSQTAKFERILSCEQIDLTGLRKLAWKGIPDVVRPVVWQLLMEYLPANASRRAASLNRKRSEYKDIIRQYFGDGSMRKDDALYHQISIDIPRTAPETSLFRNERVQKSLLRILYSWSIRRPASGYVQGINDLVTPFYYVFLSEYINRVENENATTVTVSDERLLEIEADTFWCFSKLLDSIQDNYTFTQAGIQRQITMMHYLIKRMDPLLTKHLESEGVDLLQFAFRWMNCMLMREFSLILIIRMWDTYLVSSFPKT